MPVHIKAIYDHRQVLRKKLQRIFYRTGNTVNQECQSALSELKCTTTMFNWRVKTYKESELQRRFQDVKPGLNTFKQLNNILGRMLQIHPVISTAEVTARTNTEKANLLAEQFETNFTARPPTHLPIFITEIENQIYIINKFLNYLQISPHCSYKDWHIYRFLLAWHQRIRHTLSLTSSNFGFTCFLTNTLLPFWHKNLCKLIRETISNFTLIHKYGYHISSFSFIINVSYLRHLHLILNYLTFLVTSYT